MYCLSLMEMWLQGWSWYSFVLFPRGNIVTRRVLSSHYKGKFYRSQDTGEILFDCQQNEKNTVHPLILPLVYVMKSQARITVSRDHSLWL